MSLFVRRTQKQRKEDKVEILEFLNKNPICWLASVEGNRPRVRGMMMYRADGSGILFHTAASKDLPKQLRANPNVELCFEHIDMENMEETVQVRVVGTVEFIEDQTLKEEIVAARPFLKGMVDAQGYGVLTVFRVKDCQASVWTFARNLEPKEWIRL